MSARNHQSPSQFCIQLQVRDIHIYHNVPASRDAIWRKRSTWIALDQLHRDYDAAIQQVSGVAVDDDQPLLLILTISTLRSVTG